jgi:hypothetical protein
MIQELVNAETLAKKLTALIEAVVVNINLTYGEKIFLIDTAIDLHKENPIPNSQVYIDCLSKLK